MIALGFTPAHARPASPPCPASNPIPSHPGPIRLPQGLKEPSDLFDTLEKFLVRFEAACKEVDDARKEAERDKGVRKPRLHKRIVPGGPKLGVKKAGASSASLGKVEGAAGGADDSHSTTRSGSGSGGDAAELPTRELHQRGKRLSGSAAFLQSATWKT